MPMRELVRRAATALEWAAVPSPYNDARRLAQWAAGVDLTGFALEGDRFAAEASFCERFGAAVERRGRREPLQYIEGSAAFLDFELEVGPGVLVPRPETEVVALTAIGLLGAHARALDCGTGSGALAIALARAHPQADVHATERSQPALVWAAKNLARLAPDARLHQTWFFGTPGPWDLVVSNPPYVSEAEWAMLEPEVRDWEPKTALVPQDGDGNSDIAMILRAGWGQLAPGGWLVCEVGAHQGADAKQLAAGQGYEEVDVHPDLAGRDRVLVSRKPGL